MIKGLKGIKDALGKSTYLKLEDGQSAVVRIISPDDFVAVYEHTIKIAGNWKTITCLGKQTCPLCHINERASYKVYIPLLDRTDDKVKIFKASREFIKALIALEEEYGDITKRNLKITRDGKGLNTKYHIFPKDAEEIDLSGYEIPNIEETVAPMTPEAIRFMMESSLSPEAPATDGDEDDEYPF